MSLYPCLQQFGLLFGQRLRVLGLSSSQVTTIVNTQPAVAACSGLLNGPMFRRFTFRQVAMAGALLSFTGIALSGFCETFAGYIVAYSVLYGKPCAIRLLQFLCGHLQLHSQALA